MTVVVLAWGNEARGDDGIGPALAAHVAERWPDVALIADDQLQIEHALELKDRTLALFVDAGRDTPRPYRFYETAARPGLGPSSHALSPESLLDVCRRIGVQPPPAFVLCIPGERWGLGETLSEIVKGRIELARTLIDQLLSNPDAQRWRLAITHAPGLGSAAGA